MGAVAKPRAGAAKTKNVETPNKIGFRFEKDDGYRLVPVNSVWGGPTPRGDIKVDFFHESQPLPEVIQHVVTPEGRLRRNSATVRPRSSVRSWSA